MTTLHAIPLDALAKSNDKSSAKPALWYGPMLERARERIGLSRKELAAEDGIDYVKILRNENGSDERSVKASSEIRDALVKRGASLPPVPVGDVPEPESIPLAPVDAENPRAALLRRNLRRIREEAGYEVEGLADAVNLSADTILAYERGDRQVPYTDLEEIARATGHAIDHFSMESPPPSSLAPHDNLWRRRRLHARLTPEQRAKIQSIQEEADRQIANALSPEFAAVKKKSQKPSKR